MPKNKPKPKPRKPRRLIIDKMDTDRTLTLGSFGGAVRALRAHEARLFQADEIGEDQQVIAGMAVIFDTDDDPVGDLDGLFFTRKTDLGPSNGNGGSLTFNHMQPIYAKGIESQVVLGLSEHIFKNAIRTLEEEEGLYMEALLEIADEHEQFIAELISEGIRTNRPMGLSTGVPGHMARLANREGEDISFSRALEDQYGEMKLWPIAETAITPIYAEPRTAGVFTMRAYRDKAFYALGSENIKTRTFNPVELSNQIFDAFRLRFDPQWDRMAWVEGNSVLFEDDLASGTIVAYMDDSHFRIPFTRSDDEITFAAREEWEPVKLDQQWVARVGSKAYFAHIGKPLLDDQRPDDSWPKKGETSRFALDPNPKPTDTRGKPMFDHLKKLIAQHTAATDDAVRETLRTAILMMVEGEDLTEADETTRTAVAVLRVIPQPSSNGMSPEDVQVLLDEQAEAFDAKLLELKLPASRGSADGGPGVIVNPEPRRLENVSTKDLLFVAEVFQAGNKRGMCDLASPALYHTLARRMSSDETVRDHGREERFGGLSKAARAYRNFARVNKVDLKDGEPGALRATTVRAQVRWNSDAQWTYRANELMGSTVTDGGDEWIGVGYSNTLWDDIYNDQTIVAKLNPQEWPFPGAESGIRPVIDGDVTVYKVAQTTDLSATPGGTPVGKTTESKLDTGNRTHTLAKMGARTVWTGELDEDSVLPFAATLRENMTRAAGEALESAIIDGDTDASASTNINDIAGTPGATDYFLTFDGLRKLPLITTTANSVSVGTLLATDFTAIRKLLGVGGARALDPSSFSYIMDTNTYYMAIDLPEVKTVSEIGPAGTILTGQLQQIYGTEIIPSAFMHLVGGFQQSAKANTAGKVDQDTAGNNTTGSILAVPWLLWTMYWRRRVTIETMRWPYADATEIVLHLRASLQSRDVDSSAIGYNITV